MTYLETHDFTGKAAIPFITHEGSRMGKNVQDVKRLTPGATGLAGESFWGSRVRAASGDVGGWLRELNLAK